MHTGVINLVLEACLFSANKSGGDRATISSRAAVFSRYWFSVLSFTLQRSIATSILSRLKLLTSLRFGFDYSVCEPFILNSFGLSSLHFSEFDSRQFLASASAASIPYSQAFSASSPSINFGNSLASFDSMNLRRAVRI